MRRVSRSRNTMSRELRSADLIARECCKGRILHRVPVAKPHTPKLGYSVVLPATPTRVIHGKCK